MAKHATVVNKAEFGFPRERRRSSATKPAASGMLGGLHDRIHAHDAISKGLSVKSFTNMISGLEHLASDPSFEKAVGVGKRSYQRRRAGTGVLSPEQSARAWRFADVFAKAESVLGSKAEAELWLASPALALGRRRPLDLLATPAGADLVKELLDRMEYGVYA